MNLTANRHQILISRCCSTLVAVMVAGGGWYCPDGSRCETLGPIPASCCSPHGASAAENSEQLPPCHAPAPADHSPAGSDQHKGDGSAGENCRFGSPPAVEIQKFSSGHPHPGTPPAVIGVADLREFLPRTGPALSVPPRLRGLSEPAALGSRAPPSIL